MSKTVTLEQHYSPAQVADRLGLHRQTILKLVKAGSLGDCSEPVPRQIRIPASGVNRYLSQTCISPR